jgi:hypothetical protein
MKLPEITKYRFELLYLPFQDKFTYATYLLDDLYIYIYIYIHQKFSVPDLLLSSLLMEEFIHHLHIPRDWPQSKVVLKASNKKKDSSIRKRMLPQCIIRK